jgi:hypothetical protein
VSRFLRALRLRRSAREYSDRKLPPQVLSDLLWAAFGINRPIGDRTAPYWRHVMVIDVYASNRGRADQIAEHDREIAALADGLSSGGNYRRTILRR